MISKLQLLRLNFKEQMLTNTNEFGSSKLKDMRTGCIVKHEFELNQPNSKTRQIYTCKVYKRIRYLDESKSTKVHDCKIKVIQ